MSPRAFIEACVALADDRGVAMAEDLRAWLATEGTAALASLEGRS